MKIVARFQGTRLCHSIAKSLVAIRLVGLSVVGVAD